MQMDHVNYLIKVLLNNKNMKIVRTQEEILNRLKTGKLDIFGTQRADLVDALTYENAEPFLEDDYKKAVKDGSIVYDQLVDPLYKIVDYIDFAQGKIDDERGLSAMRSMLHFKTWIWLIDPEFYNEIGEELEEYNDYGQENLDRIKERYIPIYEARTMEIMKTINDMSKEI